jgi:hypothetical protein
MAALATVSEYIAQARVLVQDTRTPYRYSDADFCFALSAAMLEARKLRPDLFLATLPADPPSYTTADTSVAVAMDPMYRMPVLYYTAGYVGIRDAEPSQEARSAAFIALFSQKLLGAI